MSWTSNQSIRFRLGAIALYNILTRKTIDARNPALPLIKDSYERMAGVHAGVVNEFEDMMEHGLPANVVRYQKGE